MPLQQSAFGTSPYPTARCLAIAGYAAVDEQPGQEAVTCGPLDQQPVCF
jgi:hypothetical protein